MVGTSLHPIECLISCENGDTYREKIGLLSNTEYIQQLFRCASCKNFRKFLSSEKDIPHIFEEAEVTDFEKKRSLICEFLIHLHMAHPKIFTLQRYLHATKLLFTIMTQCHGSREDIASTLQVLILYVRTHFYEIPQDCIREMLHTLHSYGPWRSSEMQALYDEALAVDISGWRLVQQSQKNAREKKIRNMKKAFLEHKKKKAGFFF